MDSQQQLFQFGSESSGSLYATSEYEKNSYDFADCELGQSATEKQLDILWSTSGPEILSLNLCRNRLRRIPPEVHRFKGLLRLDLTGNELRFVEDNLVELSNLRILSLKNNSLDDESLPKDFGRLEDLEELNLSGNRLTKIPHQIVELDNLRSLHLGGNLIAEVPSSIKQLQKLEILYLGGNRLSELPAEMGYLQGLRALILCENKLESLPPTISQLKKLRSLALHKNHLTTLPPELVTLRGLEELSLRDNPLVVHFVRDMINDPPSLLELAARCIKVKNVVVNFEELPWNLRDFLCTAQRCVNPKCKGVYFDARVEHIKFVDFCGKYRIPLLQFLCSPRCKMTPAFCSSESDASDDDDIPRSRLKKVLLG